MGLRHHGNTGKESGVIEFFHLYMTDASWFALTTFVVVSIGTLYWVIGSDL